MSKENLDLKEEGVRVRIKVEGGLKPGEEGFEAQALMEALFSECLGLFVRKTRGYGSAWRRQGYMGNIARILSKVSRLENMVWSDVEISDENETLVDTLQDLINIGAFAILNMRAKNKWGDRK